MCLAVPAQIEQLGDDGRAKVVFAGNRMDIIMAMAPEAKVGDWVLVHAGYAITVLDPDDAKATCELLMGMPVPESLNSKGNVP